MMLEAHALQFILSEYFALAFHHPPEIDYVEFLRRRIVHDVAGIVDTWHGLFSFLLNRNDKHATWRWDFLLLHNSFECGVLWLMCRNRVCSSGEHRNYLRSPDCNLQPPSSFCYTSDIDFLSATNNLPFTTGIFLCRTSFGNVTQVYHIISIRFWLSLGEICLLTMLSCPAKHLEFVRVLTTTTRDIRLSSGPRLFSIYNNLNDWFSSCESDGSFVIKSDVTRK